MKRKIHRPSPYDSSTPTRREVLRYLCVDIIPTLILLLLLAAGMALFSLYFSL